MTSLRYSRQSFLGENADSIFATCHLGIIGLGGGGSHVVQQVAHIGFQRVTVIDYDVVDTSNLNRLIGATEADAEQETPKGKVAERLYRGLQPNGNWRWIPGEWQTAKPAIRECDLIIAGLDDLTNRLDLEKICRRYLIPLIDVGMDITIIKDQPPRCAGQVALSLPGHHCFHCLKFRDERTGPNYGDAGPRPQVVWPNGVLASTAVGLAVEILTGWTERAEPCLRLQYDGNTHLLAPFASLEERLKIPCNHFPSNDVGDVQYPP